MFTNPNKHTAAKFLITASFIGLASCGTKKSDSSSSLELIDRPLLENYVDAVILPTYTSLSVRAGELVAAMKELEANQQADILEKARTAWVNTRAPWEQSEGFLFGPVDQNGYDPSLDTWPLNKTDLDLVLNSNISMTPEYAATLADNQKGFHTVEYLIYGESSNKTASQFTAREFEYLKAISQNLQDVANLLVDSWNKGDKPFRTTFVSAGEAGNTVYPSLKSAGEEIINGIVGICDEVADGKIATPFDAKDPNLVESQFSLNSLQDFSDNIRSVQNAWMGHVAGATVTAGVSLHDRIETVDQALADRVTQEIQNAIDAILEIPGPFPTAILNDQNGPVINNAQDKIRIVRDSFQANVLPLIAN